MKERDERGGYIIPARKAVKGSWAVTVERNGEQVVTLESNCLSGRDLSPDDEHVIETAARHLLAFIGHSAQPLAASLDEETPRPKGAVMGTVLVDYYDAECVRCGWKHRVMYGASLGKQIGHTLAFARHANATAGRCGAFPDEIREQSVAASALVERTPGETS